MSPPPLSLPDEIVDTILSHLDAVSIARIERVCRQWKTVGRKNQPLWRDALYLDDREADEWSGAEAMARRIDALSERGGGRLDRLAIQLFVPECSGDVVDIEMQHHFQHIFAALPRLGLRELRIELAAWDTYVNDDKEKYAPLLKHIEEALRQCGHLTKLYIDAQELYEGWQFRQSLAGAPLATCALQHIHIDSTAYSVHNLFAKDDTLIEMLRCAKHVTMPIKSVDVWRVLEASSATLETCNLDVMVLPGLDDRRPVVAQRRQIAFPHLTSLKIRVTTDSTPTPPRRPTSLLDHQIVCPALEHLALVDYADWLGLLRGLLCDGDSRPALQTLCIGDLDAEESVAGLGPLLYDRYAASLRAVKFHGEAVEFIRELTSLPTMGRLTDVTFVAWDEDFSSIDVQLVRDLVQSRLAQPKYQPFRSVRFVDPRDTDVLSFDDEEEVEEEVQSDGDDDGWSDEDEDVDEDEKDEADEDKESLSRHAAELNALCAP